MRLATLRRLGVRFLPLALLLVLASPSHAQSTSWTGAISSDWEEPGNWTNGAPDYATDAHIGIAGVSPVVSLTTSACSSLYTNAGSVLTVDGELSVLGSLEADGSLTGAGMVTQTGTGTLRCASATVSVQCWGGPTTTGDCSFADLLVLGLVVQHEVIAAELAAYSMHVPSGSRVTVVGNATFGYLDDGGSPGGEVVVGGDTTFLNGFGFVAIPDMRLDGSLTIASPSGVWITSGLLTFTADALIDGPPFGTARLHDLVVQGSLQASLSLEVGRDLTVEDLVVLDALTVGRNLTVTQTATPAGGTLRLVNGSVVVNSGSLGDVVVETMTLPAGSGTLVVNDLFHDQSAPIVIEAGATLQVDGTCTLGAAMGAGTLDLNGDTVTLGLGSGFADMPEDVEFSGSVWTASPGYLPAVYRVHFDGPSTTLLGDHRFREVWVDPGASVRLGTPTSSATIEIDGPLTIGGQFENWADFKQPPSGPVTSIRVDPGGSFATYSSLEAKDLYVAAGANVEFDGGSRFSEGDVEVHGSVSAPGGVVWFQQVNLTWTSPDPLLEAIIQGCDVLPGTVLVEDDASLIGSKLDPAATIRVAGRTRISTVYPSYSETSGGTLDLDGDVEFQYGGLGSNVLFSGPQWIGSGTGPFQGTVTFDSSSPQVLASSGSSTTFGSMFLPPGSDVTIVNDFAVADVTLIGSLTIGPGAEVTTGDVDLDGTLSVEAGAAWTARDVDLDGILAPSAGSSLTVEDFDVGASFPAVGSTLKTTGTLLVRPGVSLAVPVLDAAAIDVEAGASLVLTDGVPQVIRGNVQATGSFSSVGDLHSLANGTWRFADGVQLPGVSVVAGATAFDIAPGATVGIQALTVAPGTSFGVTGGGVLQVQGLAQFYQCQLTAGAGVLDLDGGALLDSVATSAPCRIRCSKDFVAVSSSVDDLELDGLTPTHIQAPTLTCTSLTTRNSTRTLGGDTTLNTNQVTVAAGSVLDLEANDLHLFGLAPDVTVHGELALGPGGKLRGPRTVRIAGDGALRMTGNPSAPAVMRGASNGPRLTPTLEGTIVAQHFRFELLDKDGVVIRPGATFGPPPFDMRGGELTLGAVFAPLLTIDRDTPTELRYLEFGNTGFFGSNVRSTTGTATVTLVNAFGPTAAPGLEDDPNDLIEWVTEETLVEEFSAEASALPDLLVGVDVAWSTSLEVDTAAFVVQRRRMPAGSWERVANVLPSGPQTYTLVDQRGLATGTYEYRLSERLTHDVLQHLATDVVELVLPAAEPGSRLPAVPTAVQAVSSQDGLRRRVRAAEPGAFTVLELAPGTHQSFEVRLGFAGTLVVRAAGPDRATIDASGEPIRIDGLAKDAAVLLQGVDVDAGSGALAAIEVLRSDGVVLLDDVRVRSTGGTAVRAVEARAVVLQSCALDGDLAVGSRSLVSADAVLSGYEVGGGSRLLLASAAVRGRVAADSTLELVPAPFELDMPWHLERGGEARLTAVVPGGALYVVGVSTSFDHRAACWLLDPGHSAFLPPRLAIDGRPDTQVVALPSGPALAGSLLVFQAWTIPSGPEVDARISRAVAARIQ